MYRVAQKLAQFLYLITSSNTNQFSKKNISLLESRENW